MTGREQSTPRSYAEAGVDIDRGDAVAARIAAIRSPALGNIGGFAGALELDPSRWRRPRLLTTCDGVGTKILVAKALNKYDTIGIDLVAMCVNDLAVCGAMPLAFQDYVACGRVVDERIQAIVQGVVTGCEIAGCTLSGGETAEMPDVYGPDDVDLAGFCAGIAEEDDLLPRLDRIQSGDLVFGIPSAGIHSNGLSLARKVLDMQDKTILAELLRPTRIYTGELRLLTGNSRDGFPLAQERLPHAGIKAAAHITGGGIEGNLRRVLPPGLSLRLSWDWEVPAVFDRIASAGVPAAEMRRVFNMGIGIAMVASADAFFALNEVASHGGFRLVPMGEVVHAGGDAG